MTDNVPDEEAGVRRLPVNSEDHQFHDWYIKYEQSHILHSMCSKNGSCVQNTAECEHCLFCQYSRTLDLPHLPDMVFPNNILTLRHKSEAEIQFNSLDALKCVSNNKLPLKVAVAQVWQESRSSSDLQEKVKPFDWTFTTDYNGTMSNVNIELTDERINMDKLREREKILFYHELTLFEDELNDHGVASLSVKIRVMPSSFFILLRYFLRVDNVMVRINDTRLFHEFGSPYLLREYTSRESGVQELGLPVPMYLDPNQIASYLPLKKSRYEKISFESSA